MGLFVPSTPLARSFPPVRQCLLRQTWLQRAAQPGSQPQCPRLRLLNPLCTPPASGGHTLIIWLSAPCAPFARSPPSVWQCIRQLTLLQWVAQPWSQPQCPQLHLLNHLGTPTASGGHTLIIWLSAPCAPFARSLPPVCQCLLQLALLQWAVQPPTVCRRLLPHSYPQPPPLASSSPPPSFSPLLPLTPCWAP